MTQGIEKQIGILPAVKPEAHFFQIGRKMLCADVMPSSANAPLKQGECVLDCVCVAVSHDVDFLLVVDSFVLFLRHSGPLNRRRIGWVVIGEDHIGIFADVFSNVPGERIGLHIFGVKQSKLSVSLPNTDDDFFILQAAMPTAFSVYAADKGFVHFDLAVEHWFVHLNHSSPDTMAEVPSSFIADSNGPLNLAGRNAFLGFTEKQSSH
jgi:hypothetical protein